MFGSKLDIFKLQWLDVVFANRNKAYGAYELRKENSKTTSRALVIGSVLFALAICSPMIIKALSGFIPDDEEKLVKTEVVLMPPPPVNKETPPPPPPPEPPKPKVDQIRFPPPVPAPEEEVTEEPPTVEDMKEADPGPKTIEGDPNAEIKIDEPVGEAPKEAEVTEDNSVHDFAAIEKAPEFKGGEKAFRAYIQKNYKYPPMATEQGVSGKVILQFVVEKDGSLTDIKVVRDLGMGTGDEAKRVLAKMPPWQPGIQNGRPVRVAFTLPLALSIEAQ
ncbi:energy transducer TonB [Hufsiella ginkgonis]|uniref:TonB family protein n=1 Tax=Hufsiella ginkgonis TaxID=2695274 RepID=A0A7K1Y2Q2_9SPHI|nr:energy transducer TonB [Hufsiella ginkgonis]MXV17530.1 TonB family protein [Hufsiella ginkgonis]